MKKIQSQSTSNPCSISQAASLTALSSDQSCIALMLTAFKQRHDYVVKEINTIDGFSALESQGAFYCFFNAQERIDSMDNIEDDVQLCDYILNKAEVALVPGTAFGSTGYLRLSFATSMENLQQALERLQKLFN
jgi:aspartate aminotransferase